MYGVHVFTGCDQIGRFYGKSKLEFFRIFNDCQQEKLNLFNTIGSTETTDSLDTLIKLIQNFFLDRYCKNRPDTVNDITTLRQGRI